MVIEISQINQHVKMTYYSFEDNQECISHMCHNFTLINMIIYLCSYLTLSKKKITWCDPSIKVNINIIIDTHLGEWNETRNHPYHSQAYIVSGNILLQNTILTILLPTMFEQLALLVSLFFILFLLLFVLFYNRILLLFLLQVQIIIFLCFLSM